MILYPVVLEHAAAFLGRSPWELSRSAELLFEGHRAAWEFYRQDPVVCGIDVYHLEVEAWGVTVERPAGNGVPTLGPPVLAVPEALLALAELKLERDGRLPLVLAAALRLRQAGIPVRVPMAGPVSVAAGLFGFETLLVLMHTEPERMAIALQHLAVLQVGLAWQWRDAGLTPVIYESAGGPPLVSPDTFRTLVAPALRLLLKLMPMTCVLGGDTARIAADLLACGPAAVICPAETDQAAFLAAARNWPQVAVRLNLPAAVWRGAEAVKQVDAAINRAVALIGDQPNVALGTGVLPYEIDRHLVARAVAHAAACPMPCLPPEP